MTMRSTRVEVGLHPYSDGSGYREKVTAKWDREEGRDIIAQVEIEQSGDRLTVLFSEWLELRKAIDEAIEDAGYSLTPPRPISGIAHGT